MVHHHEARFRKDEDMRRATLLSMLLLTVWVAPASAATTGTVYVLLKNDGAGNFSALDQVKVFANADYDAYDKTANGPSTTVAPGGTFKVPLSGLYVWSGYQGIYQFEVSFWD